MYRKDSVRWIKHVDFIILDLICLQMAFVLAYAFSGYGANPYQLILYRNMAVFMEVALQSITADRISALRGCWTGAGDTGSASCWDKSAGTRW